MERRAFLAAFTGGLLATPLAVEGQQAGKVHRIGYLTIPSRETAGPVADSFQHGLNDLGWTAGRNVVIDYRFADSNLGRLPDLAAELVRLRADVIVAGANAAVIAVKNATRTIPIVMFLAVDPVDSGLVASFARPGGNITGLTLPPGRKSTANNSSCSRTPSHISRESRFSSIEPLLPMRVRPERSRSRPGPWICNSRSWKSEVPASSTTPSPR